MKRLVLAGVAVMSLGVGLYTWKVFNTGHNLQRVTSARPPLSLASPGVLVEVAGQPITHEDLDFEFRVLTSDLAKTEDLTPIPDTGASSDEELVALKDKIINSLVERKMLYKLVADDKSFDLDNSSRYVTCVEEWTRAAQGEGASLFIRVDDRERLKTRLCEQNILQQYLQEKIYGNITVSDGELREYFRNHRPEFHQPAMVVIRQIVAAEEREARTLAQKVTKANFAALAAAHSITPESQEGGVLGPFPMGSGMPRFFDVAFTMRPGQISDILKSTYGFHIIMLEKKYEERELSFQEAIPKIKLLFEQKAQERAYQKWIDLALHTVDVNTPKLR